MWTGPRGDHSPWFITLSETLSIPDLFYMGVPHPRMQPNQAFQNDAKIWHNWKGLGKLGAQIISHTFRIFAELFGQVSKKIAIFVCRVPTGIRILSCQIPDHVFKIQNGCHRAREVSISFSRPLIWWEGSLCEYVRSRTRLMRVFFLPLFICCVLL